MLFKYLNSVLHLGIFVMEDTEAKRFLWYHFYQHEITTLQQRKGNHERKSVHLVPQFKYPDSFSFPEVCRFLPFPQLVQLHTKI